MRQRKRRRQIPREKGRIRQLAKRQEQGKAFEMERGRASWEYVAGRGYAGTSERVANSDTDGDDIMHGCRDAQYWEDVNTSLVSGAVGAVGGGGYCTSASANGHEAKDAVPGCAGHPCRQTREGRIPGVRTSGVKH